MPYKDPNTWSLTTWLLAVGLSVFGGVLNLFLKLTEGKKFSIIEFIVYSAVSGFSGFLVFILCLGLDQSEFVAGALSGTAGFLGTRGWKLLTYVIKQKTGIDVSGEAK